MYPLKEEIARYTQQMIEFYNRRPALKPSTTGTLKVAVTTGNKTIPIPGAAVMVTPVDEETVLFRSVTDESGIVDNITLPAPNPALADDPESSAQSYLCYDVRIDHPDYQPVLVKSVPIFSGIESIQAIDLTMSAVSGSRDLQIISEPCRPQ